MWMGFLHEYIRVRKEFSYMHTPHPVDPLFAIILFFFCH